MAAWVWLVSHTTEFTPGPWAVTAPGDRDGPMVVSIPAEAGTDGESWPICELWKRNSIPPTELFGVEWDRERDANGVLLADAPAMLALLAQWAEQAEATYPVKGRFANSHAALYVATCDVLRRHVSLGVGPHTEPERPAPVGGEGVQE